MVKNNLWGGRFKKGPSAELVALSVSTQFDFVLAPYDIAGSIAHANALQKADLLSETEHKQITDALKQMRDELTDAENPLTYNESDEDVHSALERILIERVGVETGGKLRAGRSRNDQIATFVRMYLRDSAASIKALLAEYCGAISARAEEVFADKAVVAGRTHMQHAQPVLLAHQLMAHAWPMLRNIDRLNDFVTRLGGSPYGSGALAGNTFGMDADAIAKELGFEMPEFNSIDATASRDLVAEMLYILAQISIDMSRFAEEIIIWNTKEFDYITLADEYSTGSSIMP
ncbi:MAG: argininosuccinate lyase, partial [Bifidobacteriaceae bacterium]|nr:argininosuccinate lyase [Bifidobacteriaceae bacterium]